ncbi:amino acid permease [Sporomusa acidovorans]|uniref:Transport protein YifK n=1 Tax=Sporomusa acidovorans (strain ATCC 49682 / DSM 3132 / Mol) TaxID=1123286 RepID=A0ABZ3IVR2_SPOA4|nr:amino acid permease [Sporomusa acidovorans]OZC15245.1 putative transport protein YifK [Sporomusa acidovorans DSM 3132]SDE91017.1 amino acid/polyamine/organocation transporter, APC superfamily [Sporomusa acidovorans]
MHRRENPQELRRGLKERHIQLIALGGSIGVGLFLGSSTAMQAAGPSLLVSYLIAGILVFCLLRALGEVAVAQPVAGSFSAYAHTFLGPLAGYLTGWTYWFMWIVTGMAEITAIGVYVHYWLPTLPQWIPALLAVVFITGANLVRVEVYGEFEFWFAIIKVVAIIALIIVGLAMILFGVGNNGIPVGIAHLWQHGGFFPYGAAGPIMALSMVLFSYVGIEVIGITAGEAQDPRKTLPAAIDKVFWRIALFYIGALYVIMSIYPWTELGSMGSPFVSVFEKIGIGNAAGIMNFVVLSAALSACNSGVFSTGRMLYTLAVQGEAPAFLRTLNGSQIPVYGVLVSAVCLLVGVALNYFIPAKVFIYVTSIGTFACLWVWAIIFIVQLRFRQRLSKGAAAQLGYPMPLYPFSGILCLAMLVLVAVVMSYNADTAPALIIGPLWLLGLALVYWGRVNLR